MNTVSFTNPYGDFSSKQAVKIDDFLIEETLYDFIDNRSLLVNDFIIEDVDCKVLFNRKISKKSKIIHALKLSKNDYIGKSDKTVGVNTCVYIALLINSKDGKSFFDVAPYLVSVNIVRKDKYDIIANFYPKGIDTAHDAVDLSEEAEIMQISPDEHIQKIIPDIIHNNFLKAVSTVFDICGEQFLF